MTNETRDILELVAFMLVSARNLISEPQQYGPLRLVEASRRLVAILDARGNASETLRRIALSAGDMPGILMRSEEQFVKHLDSLINDVFTQLLSKPENRTSS